MAAARRAPGHAIFAAGESLDGLRANVRDAVHGHFDQGAGSAVIRLHFVRDGVLAA